MGSDKKSINILGVTGTIGVCAADVIAGNAEHFDVNIVSAHTDEAGLKEAAQRLGAKHAILSSRDDLGGALAEPVDITLCAISGMAGLSSMMRAIENSKAVAIANKEPLVAAGDLVIAHAKAHNTVLLPVDSEHNAIFQVFDVTQKSAIERIILTASGGPFRTWTFEDMAGATRAQALAHPNWVMGQKITIDSATMMNKALEIIEAHYLFGLAADKIEVLIHPQSTVHSMVEYCDGSVLAQMGASDMRTPIANVLAWPDRLITPGEKLDLKALSRLDFEEADLEKFPALAYAYDALDKGAYACVAMNAANEVAVEYFLDEKIGFTGILDCVRYSLQEAQTVDLPTIKDIQNYDQHIREKIVAYINNTQTTKAVSV